MTMPQRRNAPSTRIVRAIIRPCRELLDEAIESLFARKLSLASIAASVESTLRGYHAVNAHFNALLLV